MSTAPNLTPRKNSDTSSSSELHQRILDATVELFAESGYSQVTTNMIAQRAEVSVGSVYRFYPNKFAIFNAVVENFFAALDQMVDDYVAIADPTAAWEEHVDGLAERMSRLWQENRSLIIAFLVLQGNPEIAKTDSIQGRKGEARAEEYLRRLVPGRSPVEYSSMACLIYWTTLNAFDTAILNATASDSFDHAIITEYKKMLKAYLRGFAN